MASAGRWSAGGCSRNSFAGRHRRACISRLANRQQRRCKWPRFLKMVQFRLLDEPDIPWATIDAFEDRVVFQTREWLAFIAASQHARPVIAEVRDGDMVAGYFSGLVVRKFGVRIL